MGAYVRVQQDRQSKHVPEAGDSLTSASPGRSNIALRTGSRIYCELRQAKRKLFLRFHLVNAICRLLPDASLSTLRAALYRTVGFKIGPGVAFLSTIAINGDGPNIYGRLTIGEGSVFSLHPTFNLDDTITIGRNVAVSPGVEIWTGTHLIGPSSQRWTPTITSRPVIIEDGVWIGLNSVILPGVVIGRGSVISAGSVVRKSVPPNSLVGGNPAQVIKELPTYED